MTKDRKEYLKEYSKKYRQKHYEELKEKNKKWREENKEKLKEKAKEYYNKNKNKLIKYQRKYHQTHKEQERKYSYKWNKENREKINKRNQEIKNKGKVFYWYNPFTLSVNFYRMITPESRKFSPSIANSNMSLETYIAMRAVFDASTIRSLMKQLYHGSIEIEEINDMIEDSGFDMNSEEFKYLIDCIKNSSSESSFAKNYDGMIFTK